MAKLIELKKVSKTQGNQTVLDRASCEFTTGQFTDVRCASVSSKTTFLKLLAQEERPEKGLVKLNSCRSQIFLVEELHPLLAPELSVGDLMATCGQVYRQWSSQRAWDSVKTLGLTHRMQLSALPGAKKLELSLLMAINSSSQIILLDSVFTRLAPQAKAYFTPILRSRVQDGGLVVSVSPAQEPLHADRLLLLEDGKLWDGPAVSLKKKAA